ncbi:MAG: RnfABCDGE type electron transport complex subunit D [Ferruginibacter sp.]
MQLSIFKDARYFQALFQCMFLCYGIVYLHWNAEWWLYTTYTLTCVLTQFVCEIIFNYQSQQRFTAEWWSRVRMGMFSAMISSFSLSLLLKTNHWYIAVGAALITVLSKFMIRVNGKHVFNPSALGIAATIWLTGDAWISPGQWGNNAVILFAVLSLGFIVTTRVQKLDTSLAFLFSFALLLYLRQIVYLGWPMDYFIQSVTTGSLLLFSFFMISDPRTTPDHRAARIIWAMGIAGLAFYLATFKFINGAPVWVLVLAQPLVPLLDRLFKAKQFTWTRPAVSHATPVKLPTVYTPL